MKSYKEWRILHENIDSPISFSHKVGDEVGMADDWQKGRGEVIKVDADGSITVKWPNGSIAKFETSQWNLDGPNIRPLEQKKPDPMTQERDVEF